MATGACDPGGDSVVSWAAAGPGAVITKAPMAIAVRVRMRFNMHRSVANSHLAANPDRRDLVFGKNRSEKILAHDQDEQSPQQNEEWRQEDRKFTLNRGV